MPPYSPSYVSRIERGMQPGSSRFWDSAAEATGVSVHWLLHGTDGDEFELIQAKVALADGDHVAARRTLRLLLKRSDRGDIRGQASGLLADSLYSQGRHEEAVAVLAEILEGTVPTCEGDVLLRLRLVRSLLELGDTAGAAVQGYLAVNGVVAAGLGATTAGVRLRVTLAAALIEQESWELAEQMLQAASEDAASSDTSYAVWWNLAVLAMRRGRYEEAMSLADSASAAIDASLDDPLLLQRLIAAIALRMPGTDLDEVEQVLDRALAVARAQGHAGHEGSALSDLAFLALRRERPDLAQKLAEEAVVHLTGNLRALSEAQTWLAISLIRNRYNARALRIIEGAQLSASSVQVSRMWGRVAPEFEAAGYPELALRAYRLARCSARSDESQRH